MRTTVRTAFLGLGAAALLACGESDPEPAPPQDAFEYLKEQAPPPSTFDETLEKAKARRARLREQKEAEKAAAEQAEREQAELDRQQRVDPLLGTRTELEPVDGVPEGFPKELVSFEGAPILKAYRGDNGTGVVVVRVGGDVSSAAAKVKAKTKGAGWTLQHEQDSQADRRIAVFQRGKRNAQLVVLDDPDGAILQAFVFELVLPDGSGGD